MASTISKDHNFQLFKLPDAAWSTLGLKAVQSFCDFYQAHWSESAFYQILVPGIKGVQFFPSPSSSHLSQLPSFASCLVGLLTAKRCENQDWKLLIRVVLVSHQWCCVPSGSSDCVEPQPATEGWDDRLAMFSFEEQPPCSNYLQLYSPLLCTSCGCLPLRGSNSKRLSNGDCQRRRKMSKSGWIALCTVRGSHVGGGTGWRGRSVYPCEQRKFPN